MYDDIAMIKIWFHSLDMLMKHLFTLFFRCHYETHRRKIVASVNVQVRNSMRYFHVASWVLAKRVLFNAIWHCFVTFQSDNRWGQQILFSTCCFRSERSLYSIENTASLTLPISSLFLRKANSDCKETVNVQFLFGNLKK